MMSGSSRFIVITSIFAPSEAVQRFAELAEWRLVVVGDRKSPPEWSWPGVEYLAPERQPDLGYRLAEALPWNHYARKMIGYLWAIERGATVVVDTDDDNLPKSNWSFPHFDGDFAAATGPAYYNAYRRFTDAFIWPRGYPLRLLKDDTQPALAVGPQQVGVWQGLADGDPDVDAIYRLVLGEPLSFSDEEPIVLRPGTVCPFNSQNTSFRPEVFSLMYLPAFVTFRFTDILRSLIAQPNMWAAGYSVGFLSATVTQDRNAHDLLEDFGSEVPMYLQTERVVDVASAVVQADRSVEENLRVVYGALAEEGIVERAELDLLDVWLDDLAAIGGR
jgi:hypothetical protein